MLSLLFFSNNVSCTRFLYLLNSKLKNIKFITEWASETIHFFDGKIKLNEIDINTWVWRKLANTANFELNFNAFCSLT